jgi:hypothetical protein
MRMRHRDSISNEHEVLLIVVKIRTEGFMPNLYLMHDCIQYEGALYNSSEERHRKRQCTKYTSE